MDSGAGRGQVGSTMDLDDGRVVFGAHASDTHAVAQDPVCRMEIERADAAAAVDHRGEVYYFCSASCKERFQAEPERYVSAAASP